MDRLRSQRRLSLLVAQSVDITEMSERPKLEAKRTWCGRRASAGFDPQL